MIPVHPSNAFAVPARPPVDDGWTVIWTRGQGCSHLADILATGEARRADGDLKGACLAAKADLLVTSSLSTFDLVPVVVPESVDLDRVASVVAAASGGPHTSLAARVAQRISTVMGIPGSVVSVSQDEDADVGAMETLERVGEAAPRLERRLLRAGSAGALVSELEAHTLLVLGAPGGSWLQRQFFGPGKKIRSAAPNGVVVVKDAPARCFQRMDTDPVAFGPGMRVGDALKVLHIPAVPVLDEGRLLGIVRREALGAAEPTATVAEVMMDPVFVYVDDPIGDVRDLSEFLDGSPVPVVDHQGVCLGSIA